MLTEAYLLKKYRPLLTLEEVAHELHYKAGTLENYIAQGKSPIMPVKRGAKPLFHYAALARVIDSMDAALDPAQSTPA